MDLNKLADALIPTKASILQETCPKARRLPVLRLAPRALCTWGICTLRLRTSVSRTKAAAYSICA